MSLGPTGHKTSAPFELIFSDVWGPAPLFSSDGYHYFVIFVDAYTKYIWYYPLVAKSDVYSVFHQIQTFVEHQFSLKIKFVQTNWRGKYDKLSTFFKTIGIQHRLICPHTHEQNGIVERHHRHIMETGLTILGQCKAPFRFWNYVLHCPRRVSPIIFTHNVCAFYPLFFLSKKSKKRVRFEHLFSLVVSDHISFLLVYYGSNLSV
jgi:hypothetical protein